MTDLAAGFFSTPFSFALFLACAFDLLFAFVFALALFLGLEAVLPWGALGSALGSSSAAGASDSRGLLILRWPWPLLCPSAAQQEEQQPGVSLTCLAGSLL